MATYKKLLYSHGGGIACDVERAAQNGSATIVIGLGGTGKDALKRLKREVYQRVRPDDEESGKYERIKFLCIDSDDYDLWNEDDLVGIDKDSEYISISGDTGMFIGIAPKFISAKPYAKWVNTKRLPLHSNYGAGGTRQIGRYLLMRKSLEIQKELMRILTSVSCVCDTGHVNIYIMTGLGGGTGSGIFLDLCYIVQKAVDCCGALAGKAVRMLGYFFMPDVIFSKTEQENVRRYIKENSYAALKELDYCMNMHNDEYWDQIYDGFSIKTNRPPVDVAHLVSSQTVNGSISSDGYHYAMDVVSEHILQFIIDNPISPTGYASYCAWSATHVLKPHGGNHNYVIIGASRAVVPLREISTYLASLLFGKMADKWSKEPSDDDIADFCKIIGLTPDKLVRQMGSVDVLIPEIDCVYDKLPEDDNGDRFEYGYILPAPIIGPFNNQEQRICGNLKASQQSLMNPWEYGIELDDIPRSIVCRVYKELERVVYDPDRGPVYAAKMLMGDDKTNIVNIITAIRQTIREMADDAMGEIDLTVKAVKFARKAYNERGFFSNKKALFNDLIYAVRADTVKRCEFQRLRYLCEVLETVKEQLIGLYNDFFKVYSDVIINLKDTFAANLYAIGDLEDVNTDPFVLPLFRISKLRETLRAEVDGVNIDSEIVRFNWGFFRGAYDIWRTAVNSWDDGNIAKWISGYMSDTFKEYLTRSFDEHIKSIYPDVEDLTTLVSNVRDDIISVLDQKVSELFMIDAIKAPHVENYSGTISYCYAPVASSIVSGAIRDYQNIRPWATSVQGSCDRISVIKSTSCVPLFAYGLIDECYAVYTSSSASGVHLYEGNPQCGDFRNWRTDIPELRPYSLYARIDWVTPERQRFVEMYGYAEKEGNIIGAVGDSYDYCLWRTPDYRPKLVNAGNMVDEISGFMSNAGVSVTGENAGEILGKLRDYYKSINDELASLREYVDFVSVHKIEYEIDSSTGKSVRTCPEVEPMRIIVDSSVFGEDHEFALRRDYILASAKRIAVLEDETEKRKAYDAAVQRLEECIAKLSDIIREFEIIAAQ